MLAVLTTKARKEIPTKKFALPAERKYPVEDRKHAANAKARAVQEVAKGKLSKGKEEKVIRAANKELAKTAKK